MAARGSEEKLQVQNKILETFEGSFIDGKDIRIPIAGLEIKVALTCAKDIVGAGGSSNTASAVSVNTVPSAFDNAPAPEIKVTEDEAANLRKLMAELNL